VISAVSATASFPELDGGGDASDDWDAGAANASSTNSPRIGSGETRRRGREPLQLPTRGDRTRQSPVGDADDDRPPLRADLRATTGEDDDGDLHTLAPLKDVPGAAEPEEERRSQKRDDGDGKPASAQNSASSSSSDFLGRRTIGELGRGGYSSRVSSTT
jgi:hypothetical protein